MERIEDPKKRQRRIVVDGKVQCKTCKHWLDVTKDFYITKKPSGDYIASECKKCQNKRSRRWQAAHPDETKTTRRKVYIGQQEKRIEYAKEWHMAHKEEANAGRRQRNWELKLEVIEAYGGCCACCGEARPQLLSVDHVHNDGAQERRSLGKDPTSSKGLYSRLKKLGFPKDQYQVLCMNCNCAKSWYGVCPHETERIEALTNLGKGD